MEECSMAVEEGSKEQLDLHTYRQYNQKNQKKSVT